MTSTTENTTKAETLDDAALDLAVGGGRNYTGGRFQLDIGSYNVGYLNPPAPSPPPPPPPPPKP